MPDKSTLYYDQMVDSSLHWSSRYALMNGVAWDTMALIGTGEISLLDAGLSFLKSTHLVSVVRSNLVVQNIEIKSKQIKHKDE